MGGYTEVPWTSNTGHREDTQAFLFSYVNLANYLFKLPISSSWKHKAVYHSPLLGPVFGFNYDMQISDNSNIYEHSYCNIVTYTAPSGQNGISMMGSYYWTVQDIEVYQIAQP